MIETEHTIVIGASIDSVWDYTQDIRRWANLFPGCQKCTVIDESNFRWTLKVGAGGLVRTVNALVQVDQWAGPERVDFSYRLEAEPVEGSGSYTASQKGAHETEVSLMVRVKGRGSVAPMWEAVSKPLLPQLAKSFAGKLKIEIEESAGVAITKAPSVLSGVGHWLRNLWRTIFG
jgi:carbon monoxide dehydrogenase subunit G